MFVYLYSTLGRGTRLPGAPIYTGSTDTAVTPGNEATITLGGIDQGDYYVLVFYDYATGSFDDSPTDRYIFYDGAHYPGNATMVSLTGDQTLNGVAFGNDYTFQTNVLNNALFMQMGSLTVHATYTGAEPVSSIGSKKIYVYLYDSLNDSTPTSGGTRDPLPIYTGLTDSAVSVGNPSDITIDNILPGDYYIVVFYDYRSGSNPDNQTDPYIIYNNIEFPYEGASPLTISTGTELSGISFDYSKTLSSGGAFN